MGQIFWTCKLRPVTQTNAETRQMAIFKLVCELITDIDIANDLYCPLTADVFADLLLLTSSLRLFLVIQDETLRFRLSCLFSTCVVTTTVSLVNSLLVLTSGGPKIIIITLIEVRKPLVFRLSISTLTIGRHLGQRISYCCERPSPLQSVFTMR
jgi:hypothetical protein